MQIVGVIIYFMLIVGFGIVFFRKQAIDPFIKLIMAFVLGSVIIGYAYLSVALLQQASQLVIVLILFIVLFLAVYSYRSLIDSLFGFGRFLKESIVKSDKYSNATIVLLSLALIWLVLLTWTPPRAADAMCYHLALLKDIVWNEGLVFRPYYHYNFPLYFSMLFLPVYALFKGIGIQFAHLGYYLLSIVLVTKIALLLKVNSTRLLVALMLLIPIFYHEAHQAYNDWVLIFYVLAGFVLLLDRADDYSLLKLNIAFLALGFAFGVKYHAVLFLPWFVVLGWQQLLRSGMKPRAKPIGHLIFALFLMGLVAAPFYVKNYLYFGNPLWPLLQGVFGVESDYIYQVSNAKSQFLKGEYSITALIGTIKQIVTYPLIPVTAWVLVIWGILVSRGNLLRIRLGMFLYFILWYIMQPSLYWRFSMYALPIGLITVAMLNDKLSAVKKNCVKYAYIILLTATIIYGLGVGLYYSKGYLEYHLTGDLNEYHKATWFYDEYQWINSNLPEDAKLLVIVSSGQTYYLDRKYLRADPTLSALVEWPAIKNQLNFINELNVMDIDYILYENIKWPEAVGGDIMTQLIEEFIDNNPSSLIWSKKPLKYSSRVMEEYIQTELLLIRVR